MGLIPTLKHASPKTTNNQNQIAFQNHNIQHKSPPKSLPAKQNYHFKRKPAKSQNIIKPHQNATPSNILTTNNYPETERKPLKSVKHQIQQSKNKKHPK